MALNVVVVEGRLTKEPVILTSADASSKKVVFTIAVDRDYKNENGERDTDFFSAVAWNARADYISRYCSKGSRVIVKGTLRTHEYTSKGGEKRTQVEIYVDSIYSFSAPQKKAESKEPDTGIPF